MLNGDLRGKQRVDMSKKYRKDHKETPVVKKSCCKIWKMSILLPFCYCKKKMWNTNSG